MNFKHKTPVQIRFSDMDMMGHANNGVQLSYLDLARVHYFNELFGTYVDWNEAILIVAHLEIDYLAPIMLNDSIEVHTKIIKIGNKSVQMLQNIVDAKTGEVKTKTKQVMVGFSKNKGISIPVPEFFKERITQFEEELYPIDNAGI